MTKSGDRYVGMGLQKESIDIALADAGGRQEPGKALHLVYEAEPCGYVIYRHLAGKGLDCPSWPPRWPGDPASLSSSGIPQ